MKSILFVIFAVLLAAVYAQDVTACPDLTGCTSCSTATECDTCNTEGGYYKNSDNTCSYCDPKKYVKLNADQNGCDCMETFTAKTETGTETVPLECECVEPNTIVEEGEEPNKVQKCQAPAPAGPQCATSCGQYQVCVEGEDIDDYCACDTDNGFTEVDGTGNGDVALECECASTKFILEGETTKCEAACPTNKEYYGSDKKCKEQCDTTTEYIKESSKECIAQSSCDLTSHVVINNDCQEKTPCTDPSATKLNLADNTCVATCGEGTVDISNECHVKKDCSGEIENKVLDVTTNECTTEDLCENTEGKTYVASMNECQAEVDCRTNTEGKTVNDINENVCITAAECTAKTGGNYIAYTTKINDVDYVVCNTKKDCSGETENKVLDVTINECTTEEACDETEGKTYVESKNECEKEVDCTGNTADNKIVNDVNENVCLTEAACVAKTDSTYVVITASEKKVCLEKANCKAEGAAGPVYDVSTNTCIEEAACTGDDKVLVEKPVTTADGETKENECQDKKMCIGTTGNYLWNPLSNQCVSSCDGISTSVNYYPFGNECKACSTINSECTECNEEGKCTACSNGKYPTTDGDECKTCSQLIEGCDSCTSATECTTCDVVGGYYKNSENTCSVCSVSGCSECNTDGTCKTCESNKHLKDNQCKTCSEWMTGCNECSSATECTTCDVAGGYYKNSENTCSECTDFSEGCLECNLDDMCTKCDDKLELIEGICITNATNCTDNCESCWTDDKCFMCEDGFYLTDNFTCSTCTVMEGCVECNATDICTECAFGYELNEETNKCEIVTEGTCGKTCFWKKNDDVLNIWGTGAMDNFNTENIPWMLHKDVIKSVKFQKESPVKKSMKSAEETYTGITTIGDNAFNGMSKIEKVEIPETVTVIGNNAFSNCSSLKEVVIPESVTTIGKDTFSGCGKLETVTYNGKADPCKEGSKFGETVTVKVGKNYEGDNFCGTSKLEKDKGDDLLMYIIIGVVAIVIIVIVILVIVIVISLKTKKATAMQNDFIFGVDEEHGVQNVYDTTSSKSGSRSRSGSGSGSRSRSTSRSTSRSRSSSYSRSYSSRSRSGSYSGSRSYSSRSRSSSRSYSSRSRSGSRSYSSRSRSSSGSRSYSS